MTYQELYDRISKLTPVQQNRAVVVMDENGFQDIAGLDINPEIDDADHYSQIEVGQPYIFV